MGGVFELDEGFTWSESIRRLISEQGAVRNFNDGFLPTIGQVAWHYLTY